MVLLSPTPGVCTAVLSSPAVSSSHRKEQGARRIADALKQNIVINGIDLIYRILSRYQLAEFELCVLGNLCPETVEEAIALVPSIRDRGRALDDEAIEKMLNDLSLVKKFE